VVCCWSGVVLFPSVLGVLLSVRGVLERADAGGSGLLKIRVIKDSGTADYVVRSVGAQSASCDRYAAVVLSDRRDHHAVQQGAEAAGEIWWRGTIVVHERSKRTAADESQ